MFIRQLAATALTSWEVCHTQYYITCYYPILVLLKSHISRSLSTDTIVLVSMFLRWQTKIKRTIAIVERIGFKDVTIDMQCRQSYFIWSDWFLWRPLLIHAFSLHYVEWLRFVTINASTVGTSLHTWEIACLWSPSVL